jgi:hypothetical protein
MVRPPRVAEIQSWRWCRRGSPAQRCNVLVSKSSSLSIAHPVAATMPRSISFPHVHSPRAMQRPITQTTAYRLSDPPHSHRCRSQNPGRMRAVCREHYNLHLSRHWRFLVIAESAVRVRASDHTGSDRTRARRLLFPLARGMGHWSRRAALGQLSLALLAIQLRSRFLLLFFVESSISGHSKGDGTDADGSLHFTWDISGHTDPRCHRSSRRWTWLG